jgi:hypothetical protein
MTELVNQPSAAPVRKLQGTGVAGILTIAILSLLDLYVPGLSEVISEPVYAGVVLAVGLVGGYFTKSAKADV